MDIPEHIFRSYDIRGKLEEVTADIARLVGQSVVANLGAKTVVIGRDMRQTSPELMEAAIDGITTMGGNAIDIGMCTTSLFNYCVTAIEGVDLGIMVTASHNPAEYNGIKVNMATSEPVPGKKLLEVVKMEKTPIGSTGSIFQKDMLSQYLEKCLSHIDLPDLTGTKIVVDYGNGMGVTTVRPLCELLGVDAIELYPEPDATFPNHEANPAVDENLVDLKEVVLQEGASLGIALDGDVDRMKIVDNSGEIVPTDISHALLMSDIIKERGNGTAVLTMNMSRATRKAIEKAGGKVEECPVGRTNVISKMIEANALIGGEVSGHIMFRDFHSLESIDHAIVRLLSVWKRSGKTMADLMAGYKTYANSGEVNREVADKDAVLKKLEETYAPQATEVSKEDGIRCIFGDEWWFIVRPSNTEPVIRLTVEARSLELMEQKRDEILALISS